MSELLRLANELVRMRKEYIPGEWETVGDLEYADDAIKVIYGYQDLIRRMAEMLEACSSYGHGLWSQKLDTLAYEARESIPKEQRNE